MKLAARLALVLVQAYRVLVSPLLPPSCRFLPSCSEYALDALRLHGAARGGWLTLRRLARCHPWCAGGLDLVPPAPGRGGPPESARPPGIPFNRWPAALRGDRGNPHR